MNYFSDIISQFETAESYVVTRRGATVLVKGRPTTTPSSTFNITASVQPLTGTDLNFLPEGENSNNIKVLYTDTELKTVSSNSPDSIVIQNTNFKVINVERWIGFDSTYFRCLVQKDE